MQLDAENENATEGRAAPDVVEVPKVVNDADEPEAVVVKEGTEPDEAVANEEAVANAEVNANDEAEARENEDEDSLSA